MGPSLDFPTNSVPLLRENGQATVENALVLPLQLFVLLGVIQLALAYQARIVNDYAAYKVARAASLYRLDCGAMTRAGLMALLPTISRTGRASGAGASRMQNRWVDAARTVLTTGNRPPNAGTTANLVMIDYRLSGGTGGDFDELLEPNEEPFKVHVRLAYFFEYRIPFANQLMARFWLAGERGVQLTGMDLAGPHRKARVAGPSANARLSAGSNLIGNAEQAINDKYFTIPIISTFSLRMMSDPLPGKGVVGACP